MSTIRQRRKERERERQTNEKKEEESSDDYISFVCRNDTLKDCLLKLDIFPTRHVLERSFEREEEEEKKDDTHTYEKKPRERRLRKKVRDYGRSLRENEERDYSFLFSPSTWTLCIQKRNEK